MDKILRYGEVRKIAEDVEETRTIEFVISSDRKDRHGTVMNMDNWQLDNFNNNGIVGYQHNVYGGGWCEPPNPDDVIGIGKSWIEKTDKRKLLIGSVKFETKEMNPLAEKIFRKILFGSLKAASIGMRQIGKGKYGEDDEALGEKNETFYWAGQELFEFSIVNIPSNTEALKRNMTIQAEQGITYLKNYISDNIKKDIDVNELKVSEVLELLDGKTDNYFQRIVEKKDVKEIKDKEEMIILDTTEEMKCKITEIENKNIELLQQIEKQKSEEKIKLEHYQKEKELVLIKHKQK